MKEKKRKKGIVLNGFEPLFPAPKAGMIDHYTTGLFRAPGFTNGKDPYP